jgi:hypothetical protein
VLNELGNQYHKMCVDSVLILWSPSVMERSSPGCIQLIYFVAQLFAHVQWDSGYHYFQGLTPAHSEISPISTAGGVLSSDIEVALIYFASGCVLLQGLSHSVMIIGCGRTGDVCIY